MSSYNFTKQMRILKKGEFAFLKENGHSVQNRYFKMIYMNRNADDEITRLGIIATRKYGKAVKRNRAKRLLRESFRLLFPKLSVGFDLVIIIRMGAEILNFQTFNYFFKALLKESGILNEEN